MWLSVTRAFKGIFGGAHHGPFVLSRVALGVLNQRTWKSDSVGRKTQPHFLLDAVKREVLQQAGGKLSVMECRAPA